MTKNSLIINGVEFLSREAVMEKFDISPVTLWKWTSKGVIRHHKLGKRIYFIESEICEDIKNSGSFVRKSHKEVI